MKQRIDQQLWATYFVRHTDAAQCLGYALGVRKEESLSEGDYLGDE